jgi:hypothetical protein
MSSYSHVPVLLNVSFDNKGVGGESSTKLIATGTGFLYKVGEDYFLITNWHMVTGDNIFTQEEIFGGHPNFVNFCPGIKYGGPNNALRSVKPQNLDLNSITLPLYENGSAVWFNHPCKKCDIVAIPIKKELLDKLLTDYNKLLTHFRMPCAKDVLLVNDIADTEFPIEIADEVFVLGFPFGHTASTSGRQLPIWKRGTIATEPDENYYDNTIFGKALLIDTITHEGMSGSPVLACKRNYIMNGTPGKYTHLSNAYKLLGIYSGRKQEKEESYLGVVWRRELIDEIILGKKVDGFLP